MPHRPRRIRPLWAAAALVVVVGCGDDDHDVADERADQAEQAAIDAGLDDDVAEFLGLLARGRSTTYEVVYPGTADDTELVVHNRPPDRRVDVVVGGAVTESHLVVEGSSYRCVPADGADGRECERTDALVDPPGLFDARALDALTGSLRSRTDDFTFAIEETAVAGTDATCLVTRVRAERVRAELGDGGSICASPEGAILRVDQAGEVLEATAYTPGVDPDAFERPSV